MNYYDLIATMHSAWAETATCFMVEVSYPSVGRCLFIGPFDSPQEAMTFDAAFCDEQAELFPDSERCVTTVYPVRPVQWPKGGPS